MVEEPSPADYAWSVPGGLVERLAQDPDADEIWCYTDRFSYARGETVEIRVHTTAPVFHIDVIRDGHRPQTVRRIESLPGVRQPTSDDAYRVGRLVVVGESRARRHVAAGLPYGRRAHAAQRSDRRARGPLHPATRASRRCRLRARARQEHTSRVQRLGRGQPLSGARRCPPRRRTVAHRLVATPDRSFARSLAECSASRQTHPATPTRSPRGRTGSPGIRPTSGRGTTATPGTTPTRAGTLVTLEGNIAS